MNLHEQEITLYFELKGTPDYFKRIVFTQDLCIC